MDDETFLSEVTTRPKKPRAYMSSPIMASCLRLIAVLAIGAFREEIYDLPTDAISICACRSFDTRSGARPGLPIDKRPFL